MSKTKTPEGVATFAGGCFWCMVGPFQELDGVISVTSGYTGGELENPTYEEVCTRSTGHYEAVRIIYDPEVISYAQLLDVYWRQIDPTDAEGQFADRGQPYFTAIFYHNKEQKDAAVATKEALAASGRFTSPIQTAILPAKKFYPAEEYHQEYHKKNPAHYNMYRKASGRDDFIKKHWEQDG